MEKVKAKKQYGQNFLKDTTILDKIIQSMPNNNNYVVEIGPGLGDLTKNLVKYKDMTAYEVDTDLISILKSKFAIQIEEGKLKLIHTDVLVAWDKQKTLHDGKYDYIATNIILRAFEDKNCEHIIVMVQKEVAEKFTAKVNDKDYSSLGIITELISIDSRILFDVPPESFDPPPKIISSILYIKKDIDKYLDKDFNKFLKACFVQPRKKLSKNLTSVLSKDAIFEIYKELNIDDNVRPHEVSSSLYSQMHTRVKDGRN